MMASRYERGFTLMEILVAIFVMSVGLTGIIAVFPAGIKMGSKAVEDTYSGILAQSVIDGLKVAMRENRFEDPKRGGTYVVFDHDGITDDPSQHRIKNPDYEKDFVLLLPQYFSDSKTKVFIYPETSNPANGRGSSADAKDDDEDRVEDRHGESVFEITKTFEVGQFIKQRMSDPEVSDYEKREILSRDPITQYSFAIIIKRAKVDTNKDGEITKDDLYSNFLFDVEVRIYRNFRPDPKSKGNEAIHSISTLMEL
ncbi:MAG: prepilin-type N-terminal cleavage/methylation domain-containing protein [Planctomycetota bacterium]|nr:prepilin-type N-terminal cleavage/methylation domain-containing protein [Planctomycetota bacterium]